MKTKSVHSRKQSFFVLLAVLAIGVVYGCSQGGENAIENPLVGAGATQNSTADSATSNGVSTARVSKVLICHIIQEDENFPGRCRSIVLEVSSRSFPRNHAIHGDFATTAPKKSCNCEPDDGPI